MKKPIIGIDLGNTNVRIAYLNQNGKPQMTKDRTGQVSFPSVVSFDVAGGWTVGEDAVLYGIPENTVVRPMEFIGKSFDQLQRLNTERLTQFVLNEDGEVVIDAHRVFPTIAAVFVAILSHAKRLAEQSLGQSVEEAVIALPDGFGDPAKVAIRKASEQVGLSVKQLLNQTTAAALGYRSDIGPLRDIVVVDVGASHSSAAIVRSGNRSVNTVEVRHRTIGTNAFEQAIVRLVRQSVSRGRFAFLASDHPIAKYELLHEAQLVLPALSEQETVSFSIGVADSSMPKRYVTDIARSTFEAAIRADLGQLQDMLREITVRPDAVILIGGGSHIPTIRDMVNRTFGRPLLVDPDIDPACAVALGAAVKGGILDGSITSESLEYTVHDLGTFYRGDQMDVLIPKGTKIPYSNSKTYHMGLRTYEEKVYQWVGRGSGQDKREHDQDLIVLKKAQVTLDGTSVQCIFDIDINGVATFTAVDVASGRRFVLTGFDVR